MKRRPLGFALLILATLGIAGASEVSKSRARPRPSTPVSAEVEATRHLGAQVGSDVFTGRGAKAADIARLFADANHPNLAADAYAGLIVLRNTPYRDAVIAQAHRDARSADQNLAFSAISLLECWERPEWRGLALRREKDADESLQILVDEAKR